MLVDKIKTPDAQWLFFGYCVDFVVTGQKKIFVRSNENLFFVIKKLDTAVPFFNNEKKRRGLGGAKPPDKTEAAAARPLPKEIGE